MDEQEMRDREQELTEREKALVERERAVLEQEKGKTRAWDAKNRMVKIPKGTKMVKIKALRPVMVTTQNGRKVLEIGTVAEVPEDEAKAIVESSFSGPYPFSGERFLADGNVETGVIRRAEYA